MSGDWHKVGNVRGADGVGVPRGGARGDVLKKEGGADHATSWGKVSYEDIEGKVPAAALPEISLEPFVVDSEAAMLNLPAVPGRQAIRTDIGATFVLAQAPASTLENWIEMVSRSDVTSVNSKTGAVVLTKADLGLENVNNTADSDKPLATTSVPGLMPAGDRLALNDATPSASAGKLVRRDGTGRFNVQPPTSGSHPTTKTYVDDEVNRLVAGRTPLSGSTMQTNWNNLGVTSQAAVVEGFPVGAPAGIVGAINGLGGPWDGFVKDPVWEMRHEALGLTYRKQTARLLACDPAYMVGFAWERIYNPATGKWTDWACVGGDTGDLVSHSSSVSESGVRNREWAFTHQSSTPYREGEWPHIRRIGNTVYLSGAASPRGTGDTGNLVTNDGFQIGYFRYESEWPIRRIWVSDSHVTNGMNPSGASVQQGSGENRWFLNIVDKDLQLSFRASRYGPSTSPSASTWLPFSTSWTAPQVKTWKGYSSGPTPI